MTLLHKLNIPTVTSSPSVPPASETRAVKRLVKLAKAMAAQLDGNEPSLSATTFWRYKRLFAEGGLFALSGAPMGRPCKRPHRKRAHSVTYEILLRRKKS
ncbi:MAG: hypothetical protein AB9869_00600 [Verrucomicrobiia bacterium]